MCWKYNKKDKLETTNTDSSVNYVLWGVMAVMVLIIIGSIQMFCIANSYEKKYSSFHDEWLKKRDSIYTEEIIPDSVLSKITKEEVDKYLVPFSEVSEIRESQKVLIRRQDQLTDDIRQETNNIINKMNSWLGFWMSAMAFLGVLVPIALQFKLYKENRDNEKEILDKYQKEIENSKTSLRNVQDKIDAELPKMYENINIRFDSSQENYHKDIDDIKFTAIIRCFHNIMDSPEIRTNKLRDPLLKRNWEEIVTNLKVFIEYYTSSSSIVDNYSMSVKLVQVMSVLTSLKILLPRRNRQLNSIITESNDIIQALNQIQKQDRSTINEKLINYHESLRNLHPLS